VPLPERSWEKKEEEEACLAEYLRNKTALMEVIRNKGSDSLRQRRTVSVSACSSKECIRNKGSDSMRQRRTVSVSACSGKEGIRNKGSDCFGR
jgi:hypothetical protein